MTGVDYFSTLGYQPGIAFLAAPHRVDLREHDHPNHSRKTRGPKGTIRIIANRKDQGDAIEYAEKEEEKRNSNHISAGEPILFFEVTPGDASEFAG